MIELNKLTYNSNVAALSVAGQGIKKSKEQPEITGNMKAFLETYQTLSELFGSYKTLLQEDVGKLRDVSTCMTYAEQSLIKP